MLKMPHLRDDRATRRGKTIIMDVGPDTYGWTGPRGLADLLDAAGNYIDAAKIWTFNAVTLPESYIKTVASLYRDAGVHTFSGGLLFEYAFLKNEVPGLIGHLKHMGIHGAEISENYLTLNDNERLAAISQFAEAGIEVVFEYGAKHPAEPMDLEELAKVMERVVGIGVHHVIFEQGEFDILEEQRPEDAKTLMTDDAFANLFIEVDNDRFPSQHTDLIKRFGPEINLANVGPAHVIRLESFRRGCGRQLDYPFMKDLVRAAGRE
jgi:phosphosulfolactate synthase